MEDIIFSLSSYFLNKKLFFSIGDKQNKRNIESYLVQIENNDKFIQDILVKGKFEEEILEFINRNRTKSLEELLLTNDIKEGNLIIYYGALYFKYLNRAIEDRRKGIRTFALFYKKFPEFKDILLEGEFSPDHLTCNTATAELTGYRRKFILGYIKDITISKINIRPIIIADRLLDSPQLQDIKYRADFKIRPEEIEEFKCILPYDHRYYNVEELKEYTEEKIKEWFAELINEKNIPKDWGGERSDLFTTHIHYKGRRYFSAFLFKDPSCFHKMSLKDLGRKGDQIVRLFEEPADIFILQHCHYIRSEVIKTM